MSIDIKDGLLQVFDVKHGQCALLTMPSQQGTRRILIDCGRSNEDGAEWYPGRHLKSLGVSSIDLLIATNFDEDHAAGYPDFLSQGLFANVILSNPTVPPTVIRHLKTEDGIGKGIDALVRSLEMRAENNYAPPPPTFPGVGIGWCCNRWPHYTDENNLSLVANLSILGFNFLFMGDLERSGCENILNTYAPFREMVRGTHVLIAPHHGRENGTCPVMFDKFGCTPKLTVISDDYKQYDSQETTNFYASKTLGIDGFRGQGRRYVLTTRRDGEIIFRFEGRRCLVY